MLKSTYRNAPAGELASVYSRSLVWWLNHLLLSGFKSILSFNNLEPHGAFHGAFHGYQFVRRQIPECVVSSYHVYSEQVWMGS